MLSATASRFTIAIAAAGLGAAVFAGCGTDVPSGSVAKVGDSTISKPEFQKWLKSAAAGQGQTGAPASVPDPPDFKKCIAERKTQPVQSGQKATADALKKQCKQSYDSLKGQVMQFLIQSQWVQQEAAAQKVKVSDAEVKRSFEDQKKQAFPTDKAYAKFLASSGMSEADILFRVKLDTLQQKLTQKVTEKQGKVSDADVKDYYNKNKKRFAQPQRRDLNVVLTKTKPKADQAKKAIAGGQSFKSVAKQFSIDQASKSTGGKLPDVAKGQQEKALDTAVFAAPKGKLQGPVKTQFGWYVFEVTKVTPASQQSLAQSRETIRNLLRSQRQQKALDSFIKDFRNKYKDKTACADDFRVAECKNAPKSKSDTGPASGGSPGGPTATTGAGGAGAPQVAPPSGAAPQTGGAAPQTGGAAPQTGGSSPQAPAPTPTSP